MSKRPDPRDQAGIALVETLVAAILLVIAAVGVFGAFDAATRSTAEERHRARAHALAEADLSRMRTMRISALSNLNQTRTVTQDGQVYSINSRAQFHDRRHRHRVLRVGHSPRPTTSASARRSPGAASARRPPVVAATLVAPPNGSISPEQRLAGDPGRGRPGHRHRGRSGSRAAARARSAGTTGRTAARSSATCPPATTRVTCRRLRHRARGQGRHPPGARDHQRRRREHQHGGAPVRQPGRDHDQLHDQVRTTARWSAPAPTRSSSSTPG